MIGIDLLLFFRAKKNLLQQRVPTTYVDSVSSKDFDSNGIITSSISATKNGVTETVFHLSESAQRALRIGCELPKYNIVSRLNEYQDRCCSTAANLDCTKETLAVLTLGLVGESGEIADHIKKYMGQGHDFDEQKIKLELGDLFYYVAVMSHVLGFTLQDVAQVNIDKLSKRYPDGFSVEKSKNRIE